VQFNAISSCMEDMQRRFALVQLRVTRAERDRWRRIAEVEQMRLTELVREGVRQHVRELERLRLLSAREPTPSRPSSAA
jgi:hypothetical protein